MAHIPKVSLQTRIMTTNPSHLRDPLLGPDVVGVLRELVDQLLHLDVELDGADG